MKALITIENFIVELRKILKDPSIRISHDYCLVFVCKGQSEIVIKFSPELYAMFMITTIRTLKDLNRAQGLTFMVNCMAANHMFSSTRGAALSYSIDDQSVALNFSHSIRNSSAGELLNVFVSFCDTAETLRKWSASEHALQPHGNKQINMKPFSADNTVNKGKLFESLSEIMYHLRDENGSNLNDQ